MNIFFVRILQILLVPYVNKEILWTIAPLLFGLVMVQMYFGKYKTEQLGWNTAYGNTISLMWVTAVLLKYLHKTYGLSNLTLNDELTGYFLLILILGLITLTLAVIDFNHLMSKKFAFLISSSLPTNILAYFIIVVVMGKIPLDNTTLWASILTFIFFSLVFYVYKKSITPAKSALPTLKKHEKENKKEMRRITKKIKNLWPIGKTMKRK